MNDELSITVNDKTIYGWTDVALTRGIENFPSSFDIGMTEKYPGQDSLVIVPGTPCVVKLGADPVLTGYVDQYDSRITGSTHDVRIRGRSKCEDLVDCSAIFGDSATQAVSTQIVNKTIMQIAIQLCAPFGISVTNLAGDDGPPIPFLSVNLGETVYEVLEKCARWVGLLIYDDTNGNLVFDRVGDFSHVSGFQQGKNVQAASYTLRTDARFSDYIALYQATNVLGDAAEALPNGGNNVHGQATDPDLKAIGRYRPMYVISGQWDASMVALGQNPDLGQRIATWEANRRWGRGHVVTLVADAWRSKTADQNAGDAAGILWQPNYLVFTDVPAIKVEQQNWLIASVTYQRNLQSGTSAQLVIMPPKAFDIEPLALAPDNVDAVQAAVKAKHVEDIRSQIKTGAASGGPSEGSGSGGTGEPPTPPPTPAAPPPAAPAAQPQAAAGVPEVVVPPAESVKDYGTPEMALPVPGL